MSRLLRYAAATTVAAIPTLMLAGHASAHSNAVTCVDQATSTWRITNDYPLTESFTSPQGPSGNVAAGNGSYIDVVYVGDSLQIDAVWSDGFTESRTGTGDCTPEGGTTTTEAPTTTTEVIVTTTTSEVTTSTTSVPPTTTAPTTTLIESTTTEPGTTTTPPSSSPPSSTSTLPGSTSTSTPNESTTSTSLPVPSTTLPPECSDNPNTPEDECAPICTPVTQPDGTNSCYQLPATGNNTVAIVIAAWVAILAGIVALGYGAAHRDR